MTFITLQAGRNYVQDSWEAVVTFMGFTLYFSKYMLSGWKIGFCMEWPKWTGWTLYEWLPTKRYPGDHG